MDGLPVDAKSYPRDPNYFVTPSGDLYSAKRARIRKLKPHVVGRGYKAVLAYPDGLPQRWLIHRVVLETFVGPCPDGMQCRHMNGDPADNRLENLSWGTSQENADDRIRHGTSRGHWSFKGGPPANCKLSRGDILAIVDEANAGATYISLGKKYGISSTQIGKIMMGLKWRSVTGIEPSPPIRQPVRLGPDTIDQILDLRRQGFIYQRIAEQLGISAKRVRRAIERSRVLA